jgi:hypothetical protein
MEFTGDLDAIPAGEHYRWTYTTLKGATHVSARKYKRKADAIKQGREWVRQQKPPRVAISAYELPRMLGPSPNQ